MAAVNLTEALVERFSYRHEGPSRQVLWDRREPGFGVRVTPSGGKQYVVRYRVNCRQRLMSLGPIDRFKGVKEAREEARAAKHQAYREHRDPLADRHQLAAASTVTELWETFEREVLPMRGEHTRRTLTSVMVRHVLPKLGPLKPVALTRTDVVAMHDRATSSGGKVVANRAVERLSALLNWARDRNDREFPPTWMNPCRGVRKHKEFARKHVLTTEQLRALVKSLQEDPRPAVRAFVLLLMLTGSRQGELRRLRWRDVDLQGGSALIGQSKSGADIFLRLSPAAVSVLRSLPIITGSEYVFPGRPVSQPMAEPRAAYKAALERAGLPVRTTFHDLRRSFGTSLAVLGYSEVAITAALNNTTQVAAEHYVNIAGSLVREATLKREQTLLATSLVLPLVEVRVQS